VLTSFGLRNITRKSDGQEAQEELKYHTYDLVLTNSALPEMDGYDLTAGCAARPTRPIA
jgi:CheY-like chemotaxis protein